ncbi:serine/threonine protein kinase [Paenibacillus donghaensis]|uniref:serine/threonine protein kinase n=1 Tax=Paenibacillus donghaensis TaxID=414771 RepID=UPI001883A275|nr:serine/threonine-protein kinase [Paenibacillus donghaensis]MBE9915734.1 serine/threonine protein kinase [Paenibacillus donghaensis]
MDYPSKLFVGHMIGGRYKMIRKIGEGGMSHVYLAEDLKLPGKLWAIKESVSDPKLYSSIRDEAQLLISLSHARLPRIVDFFPPDNDGYTYLVMDYIQGITLEKYFSGYRGRIPMDSILQLADQLLEVLDYLHTHEPAVIFRDLKPSNIMLTEQLELRLIDFGIARNYKQEKTQDTVKLGTVGFAAPEQYGSGQSDARSDLYGFGALLLYLSTGGTSSEWTERAERNIRSDLPRQLIPIICKLLQFAPENRYASAAEVRRELAAAIWQEPKPDPKRMRDIAGRISTQVIALLGAGGGTGTTHTAIAISHYLARSRSKVALVEMNVKSPSFRRIQQIVDGNKALAPGSRKFEVQGVDYWRQTARADVITLLSGSYDYVVIDLGTFRERERLEEFLRADIPVIVASGAEWRQQDILDMVHGLSRYPQQKWMYFLPLAGPDAVQRLRKQLNTSQVFSLPLHIDPFEKSEDMDRALQRIFQGILSGAQRRRRFRFGL